MDSTLNKSPYHASPVGFAVSLTERGTPGTCLAPVLLSYSLAFFPSLPEDKAIWYALLEPGMLTGFGAGQASLEHNLL